MSSQAARQDPTPLWRTAWWSLAALGALIVAHLVPGGPLPYADYDLPTVSWALVFVPMAMALVSLAAALRLRAALGAVGRPAESPS